MPQNNQPFKFPRRIHTIAGTQAQRGYFHYYSHILNRSRFSICLSAADHEYIADNLHDRHRYHYVATRLATQLRYIHGSIAQIRQIDHDLSITGSENNTYLAWSVNTFTTFRLNILRSPISLLRSILLTEYFNKYSHTHNTAWGISGHHWIFRQ